MATLDERPSAKRWLPLEANPEVMNQVFIPLSIPLSFITLSKMFQSWSSIDSTHTHIIILTNFAKELPLSFILDLQFLFGSMQCIISKCFRWIAVPLGSWPSTGRGRVLWCVWLRWRASGNGSKARSCRAFSLSHNHPGFYPFSSITNLHFSLFFFTEFVTLFFYCH